MKEVIFYHLFLFILKGGRLMEEQGFTYVCPLSKKCVLNKKCHVLTTKKSLEKPIVVKQLCPALRKSKVGKKEIEVTIG
mgnify:CR=1 FL=1